MVPALCPTLCVPRRRPHPPPPLDPPYPPIPLRRSDLSINYALSGTLPTELGLLSKLTIMWAVPLAPPKPHIPSGGVHAANPHTPSERQERGSVPDPNP